MKRVIYSCGMHQGALHVMKHFEKSGVMNVAEVNLDDAKNYLCENSVQRLMAIWLTRLYRLGKKKGSRMSGRVVSFALS